MVEEHQGRHQEFKKLKTEHQRITGIVEPEGFNLLYLLFWEVLIHISGKKKNKKNQQLSNIWKILRDLVFQPEILQLYKTIEEVKFLVSKVLSKQSFPTELASSSFYLCC